MEKETSTRRSLLRALYLLPLVCISLALNAQTKVNYVYNDNQADQSPKVTVAKVTLNQDSLEFTGTLNYDLIKSLPGVQFDENGNVTINGKPVRMILVNGKEYYSDAQEPIYANDIVDEVEGKAPVGYSRSITVNVDEKTDRVTIKSEDRKDSKFNATAYRIPEGTDIKELIHELPGVETDADGNITVNGKKINRILVNGKEVPLNEADSMSRALYNNLVNGGEQATPANKIIDEDGNLTIDTKNGIRVNLNGTQVAK